MAGERGLPPGSRLVFMLMGVLMVAIGIAAISWACVTTLTLTAVWIFGFMLIGGGIMEMATAFSAGRSRSRVAHLLIGVLYLLVGLMFMNEPKDSAVRLTLIFAIFLMVGGVFRIVFAVAEKHEGWGSMLINGVVTLVLGIMIYRQWPVSGLWVIGLFLGIEMLMNGWVLIMLSMGMKRAKTA